jgi:hypothetical protein
MEIVETPESSAQPIGCERTKLELFFYHTKRWLTRQRRKLPYLVWWNDEVDVTVTFSQHRLPDGATLDEAVSYLYRSRMAEIETSLAEIGISFDRGGGYDGRDWEWDWSLKGPISVRFRHRATKPERRRERLKPQLVCSR